MEWCRAPDVGLAAPDAVIFMDMPIEDAMKVCARQHCGHHYYGVSAISPL